MIRTSDARTLGLFGLLLLAAAPLRAQQPQFSPTLFWDSGLINTPAAYVQPLSGDFALNFTRLGLDSAKTKTFTHTASYALTANVSLWSRVDLGVSLFGSALKAGAFAKVLAWDQSDGIWREGWRHWLPSVAFGVRNLGSETNLNRFGQENYTQIKTVPSFYGVATRTFVLKQGYDDAARPSVQLSLDAGMGTGLFSQDASLGYDYSHGKTGGIFGGGALQFATSQYSTLSLLVEHDGWDINTGAQIDIRGLRAAVYLMELDAGQGRSGSSSYQKVAFSIGWQTNFGALVRGNRMETATTEYEQKSDSLRKQISTGEARVQALDTQLRSLEKTATAGTSALLEDLKRQIQEERDAVARLQELLRQREAAKKP